MGRIIKSNRLSHLELLYAVGQLIHATFDVEEILQVLALSFVKELHFEKAAVVYLDRHKNKPQLSSYVGFSSVEFRLLLDQYPGLLHPPLLQEEVYVKSLRGASTAWASLLNILSSTSLVLLPLRTKTTITGFILATRSQTSTRLTLEDRRFFSMYAIQASSAIDNARLYEELGQANLTLDDKVQARTKDLVSANERLRDLDEVKTNFIRMISHELRTPLTSIKGFAVTLYKYDQEIAAEKRRVYLEVLNEETDRLTRLITELLDISRIESGYVEMFWHPVDVPGLVNTLFSPFRLKAGTVTLEAKFEEGFPTIMADAAQLEQVLTNLIENAVKFSPPNGVVRVVGTVRDGGIQIDVHDQGPGIQFSEHEKVFEKFYRQDNEVNRRHPGTGLGLSICRALTTLHGGDIWIESEPDQGCCVHLQLPMNADKAVTSHRDAA